MVEFKKDVKKVLPYDRLKYIEFLDPDVDSFIEWYGVSFQLPGGYEGKEIALTKYVEVYEPLFKNLILKHDNGSSWALNHDDGDFNWFPNDENNLTSLRTLFKQYNVPNTFKGALILMKDNLLKLSMDLISYPLAVFDQKNLLYKNLDISHRELNFIIKISGHSNIDVLSTDRKFLKNVINENSSNTFIVRKYQGTSLS